MSLRNVFQDNLKSWADIKCNTIEDKDGPIVSGNPVEQVLTSNFTGATTIAGNITLAKLGNWVFLSTNDGFNSATGAGILTFGQLLPAGYRPTFVQNFIMRVSDNSFTKTGLAQVTSAGDLFIYGDEAGNSFSGTGSTGFFAFSLLYRVS